MPRVSVVIPAYKNGQYIEQTVQSVLAQTYGDFELIVSDHTSPDDTWERLQQFTADPRVKLIRTAPGGGMRANFIAASEQATGEFIKLVCGDDLLHPEALEAQVAAFDAYGDDVVLVASQRDLVDARGEMFIKARGLGSLDGKVDGGVALRATVRSGTNIFGEPGCALMRTDALRKAGWWQDFTLYIDAATFAAVLAQGPMVALRRSLATFRVSAGGQSTNIVRTHTAEAERFHRYAQSLMPAVISDADVRLGDRLAKLRVLQRRMAYVFLGKRLQPLSDAA